MNAIFKKILVMLHLSRARREASSFRFVNPKRDWFIGLIAALLLLCGGLFFAAQRFVTEIRTEYFEAGPTGLQAETYKHSVVESVLSTYEKKKALFSSIEAGVPPPVAGSTLAPDDGNGVAGTVPERVE